MNAGISSFNPDVLAASLADLPETAGYAVAFSGGGDSTALLLALQALGPEVPLRAIHVNHGLHPDAERWADRCRGVCRVLGVGLEVIHAKVSDDRGRGLEAAAREVRYGALEDRLHSGEMLLTAHTRDDQAETLLLQLLRGAGLDGLAGMAPCRPCGPGWLARPLLRIPRGALRAWLEGQGRDWVEDPDNENLSRGRNFLRHRVLPLLESRWPGAAGVVARDADNLRDARSALESWGRETLSLALTPAGNGLRLDALRRLEGPRLRQVLRLWLRDAGMPAPDSRQLAELETQAFRGRPDAELCVSWPGCQVRRHRDVLYAMPPLDDLHNHAPVEWNTRRALELPGGLGRLALVGARGKPPAWRLGVGFRRGGERIRLSGRDHHTELKSLLQELGVPPWERSRVPLVFDGDELAAVGDWRLSRAFAERLRLAGASLRWDAGGSD